MQREIASCVIDLSAIGQIQYAIVGKTPIVHIVWSAAVGSFNHDSAVDGSLEQSGLIYVIYQRQAHVTSGFNGYVAAIGSYLHVGVVLSANGGVGYGEVTYIAVASRTCGSSWSVAGTCRTSNTRAAYLTYGTSVTSWTSNSTGCTSRTSITCIASWACDVACGSCWTCSTYTGSSWTCNSASGPRWPCVTSGSWHGAGSTSRTCVASETLLTLCARDASWSSWTSSASWTTKRARWTNPALHTG